MLKTPPVTTPSDNFFVHAPTVDLPKGGGAIRGIGEVFNTNPVTGTASFSVPVAVSAGRSGVTPQVSLAYDSGAGNGPFGLGWTLSQQSISRRTDRGLPRYIDDAESDTFLLQGSEDLVPVLVQQGDGSWQRDRFTSGGYAVARYRPRIEGLFSRIERWTRISDGDTYWRTISKDNVTTYFGESATSRIADPADPSRIYTWLISRSNDDRGNAILYDYIGEDDRGVDLGLASERNRTTQTRGVNRYLKRVRYGNQPSMLVQPDITKLTWLFELVVDYGEGHYSAAAPDGQGDVYVTASTTPSQPWPVRPDPFSTFRSTFEVRTYRLCMRFLMFHHFAELGQPGALVRSTEIAYAENPVATYATSVTHCGYVRRANGTYLRRSMPALEFEYTPVAFDTTIHDLDSESVENLLIAGTRRQWIDLDSEGASGLLGGSDGAWYYKRNSSPLSFLSDGAPPVPNASFESLSEVATIPAAGAQSAGSVRFMDLSGGGRPDCAFLNAPAPGFYKRKGDGTWAPFRAIDAMPAIDWNEPNLRMFDIDGDGIADVLIAADRVFTWFESLGESGFANALDVEKADDEERGAAVVFADGTQTILIGDMSGDGLHDIVRINEAEICYWPNLGYGRFGAKVTMDNAPMLDAPDLFDPLRCRLADIDGSGTLDLIYVTSHGAYVYANQSGNAWSAAQIVDAMPRYDDICDVETVDLLGNGTSCLVWSTPAPIDERQPMRYIDFMSGTKPHLLVSMRNNLGAQTRVTYTPSTAFYLADREAGQPWVTRLPFPVQVVSRVEIDDAVSRTRFTSRYAYHHGYFDPVDREFRGFGMIERRDTDELGVLQQANFPNSTNIDVASYVPPVVVKTWFHTGVFALEGRVTRVFQHEYFHETGGPELLPDTVIDPAWIADEVREAMRALKGAMLRQEVYADDGTAAASLPYQITEHNFTVTRLQPFGMNRYPVFFRHDRETLEWNYDRTLYSESGQTAFDPRVAHHLVLDVDDYGNELQSASITYPRRFTESDPYFTADDNAVQSRAMVTYTAASFTNAVLGADAYHAPAPAQLQTFELIHIVPDANQPGTTNLFGFDELAQKIALAADGAHDLPFEDVDATGAVTAAPYRRTTKLSRTIYRADDLSATLALGTLQSRAIVFERYNAIYTPGLLGVFKNGAANLLPDSTILQTEGGFVQMDGYWWMPSGRQFYSPGPSDLPATELASASTHFFIPLRFEDSFGNDAVVTYDAYDLLVATSTDAVQNVLSFQYDYRALQPKMVTDANQNRSAAAYDALCMLVATAVMGKTTETLGDVLSNFVADPPQADIDTFFNDPTGHAAAMLGNSTTRVVYDVGRFSRSPAAAPPIFAASILRETHVSDLHGVASKLQLVFAFSDGFARVIQNKVQAEPGPLVDGGPTVEPRWVGTGWKIFDNKGNIVREYEPFFDSSHDFAFGAAIGVTSTAFYDPIGRCAAMLHADQSWSKVITQPWRMTTWDLNDTALIADPTTDGDVGTYLSRLPSTDVLPTWYGQRSSSTDAAQKDAAKKTSAHAGTPTVVGLDTLGRPFVTFAWNRTTTGASTTESHDRTFVNQDVQSYTRSITDALDRTAMTYAVDMLGRRIRSVNIDEGTRWTLLNACGAMMRQWDSNGNQIRRTYDALKREVKLFATLPTSPERLAESAIYGEGQPNDTQHNLRGRLYTQSDDAGVVKNSDFDFKGNPLTTTRQFLVDYATSPDWSVSPAVDALVLTTSTTYDALNRPTQVTAPDASVIVPAYNEAKLLNHLNVALRGAKSTTSFVSDIEYDAKGRRTLVVLGAGNLASEAYGYDPQTLRLTAITATRTSDSSRLQQLSYSYDPMGNVTSLADGAQQTLYFNNQPATPGGSYIYDALYRLSQASGRELIGLVSQTQATYDDSPRMGQPLPTDEAAMRPYTETYQYDAAGNLQQAAHAATGGAWTRAYSYDQPNVPAKNNRLTQASVGTFVETFTYDSNGNMRTMQHLPLMTWDFKDQLQSSSRQVSNGNRVITFYVYDAFGNRVRKVTESAPGKKVKERFYVDGLVEIYREYDSKGNTSLERWSLCVMDDKRRIALVETKTVDTSEGAVVPSTTIRYQFTNNIESSSLETDDSGNLISYEEYYPFGSTSLQSGPNAAEVSLKRYRYIGKERDDENALYYCGARYYAPWLGRWTRGDPAGFTDSTNLYAYASNNPICFRDPTGRNNFFTPEEVDQLVKSFEDAVTHSRPWRTRLRIDIDEPNAVSQGGRWDDAGNKQFLEKYTNRNTKNDLVDQNPSPAKPQISLQDAKNQGLEAFRKAAGEMLTRRFSEVKELEAITRDARNAMRNTTGNPRDLANRLNQAIRDAIREGKSPEAKLVKDALTGIGMDPSDVFVQSPQIQPNATPRMAVPQDHKPLIHPIANPLPVGPPPLMPTPQDNKPLVHPIVDPLPVGPPPLMPTPQDTKPLIQPIPEHHDAPSIWTMTKLAARITWETQTIGLRSIHFSAPAPLTPQQQSQAATNTATAGTGMMLLGAAALIFAL